MATYIIAGRPNSELTSQCILLMENLQKQYQSMRCVIVIKHPEEWDAYSEEISNLFGFTTNTHPLTFLSNGEFIGGRDQFFKKIKEDFKFEYEPYPKTVMDLTVENVKKLNEDYYVKKRGLALRDKIEEKLLNLADLSDKYNTLDEGLQIDFYNGMKIYYTIHPKFNPGDNIKFKEPIIQKNLEIEVIDDSNQENEEEEIEENPVVELEEGEEPIPKEKPIRKIKKTYSYSIFHDYGSPLITVYNKENYIVDHSFGKEFKIMMNPFPHFYGETILFHENKIHKTHCEKSIEIPDYGRIPSLRHLQLEEETLQILAQENVQINCEFDKNTDSYIQSNLFNLDLVPFSENDLTYLIKAVSNIEGIATVKILPYNFHDYKTFSANLMKILKLPLKDINYEDLPLNIKIQQKIKNLKREKICELYTTTLNISEEEIEKTNVESLVNHEEYSLYFEHLDYFSLETYDFPHLIRYYNFYTFKITNIKQDIKEMMRRLNITNENKKGFVILFTKDYLFMAPLVKPYIYNKGVPLFADPHFFAGLYTLPQIEAEWPYTTEGKYIKFDFEQILKTSTTE